MAFKGFNSILFDFSSIIDMELSIVNWMRANFRDYNLDVAFNKHRVLYDKFDDLKFARIYGTEDLFKSLITRDDWSNRAKEIIDMFYSNNYQSILDVAVPTACQSLVKAYKVAGDGVIKSTIRCSNDDEVKYVKDKLGTDVPIELCERPDVDMGKYGRLIIGYYKDALEYKFREPKSIMVLNFRENFIDKDSTVLKPELVVNLGDIHDIRVISAYKEGDIREQEANG